MLGYDFTRIWFRSTEFPGDSGIFRAHGAALLSSFYHNLTGLQGAVRSVSVFPGNNRWIVTSSEDNTGRVWDTENGFYYVTLHGHTGIVFGTDVSQTHNLVATASDDCRVTFWKYKVL